jgi:hypothetical protein
MLSYQRPTTRTLLTVGALLGSGACDDGTGPAPARLAFAPDRALVTVAYQPGGLYLPPPSVDALRATLRNAGRDTLWVARCTADAVTPFFDLVPTDSGRTPPPPSSRVNCLGQPPLPLPPGGERAGPVGIFLVDAQSTGAPDPGARFAGQALGYRVRVELLRRLAGVPGEPFVGAGVLLSEPLTVRFAPRA